MGRRGWLRHGNGAVISRRSEQVSHRLSAQVDRRVRGYSSPLLFLHELLTGHLPKLFALAVNTILVLAFVAHIVYHDLPLKSLP